MNYILILLFQITFNIFKVLEIQYTYERKLGKLMLNSVWINLVSLASTYYSIDSLFRGDFWVLPFYIGGSIIGKWIAMKWESLNRYRKIRRVMRRRLI